VLPEARAALRRGDKRQVQGHVLQVSHPSVKKKLVSNSVADPECLSRIRIFSIPDPHQRIFSILTQKTVSKLSGIPDLIFYSGTGYGSATPVFKLCIG
jgi:hypothetical protein